MYGCSKAFISYRVCRHRAPRCKVRGRSSSPMRPRSGFAREWRRAFRGSLRSNITFTPRGIRAGNPYMSEVCNWREPGLGSARGSRARRCHPRNSSRGSSSWNLFGPTGPFGWTCKS